MTKLKEMENNRKRMLKTHIIGILEKQKHKRFTFGNNCHKISIV